jgi:hypothetical protein
MASNPTRRQHLLQTVAFAAATLGLPALWRSRGSGGSAGGEPGAGGEDDEIRPRYQKKQSLLGDGRQPFDSRPRRILSQEQPEYVFFGDSMARAHIDPEAVTRLTGKRTSVFYLPHSTSPRWFLMLKNYLIPSGVRPKKMFVLFRNCLWHMPTFRIEGVCWDELERAMEDPADPVIAQVIGLEPRRGASPAAQLLRDPIYPIQTQGETLRQGVQSLAARLAGLDFEQVKTLTNTRTSWEHFRTGITAEESYDGLSHAATFTMDPSQSFLPHFLDLAAANGIPLHFIRIRRRPGSNGKVPNPPAIEPYITALQGELTRRGLGFTDLNDMHDLKASMYAEGDHLDIKHRTWFTERLVKRLGPALS